MAGLRVLLNEVAPEPDRIAECGRRLQSVSLLTFAPGEEEWHLPSAIVRFLKDSRSPEPTGSGPGAALAAAFGREVARRCAGRGITVVCRVLSSRETHPSPDAPLEAVCKTVAGILGARVCHPVRRTAPRTPMSAIPRLSGRDALRERILYTARDLIVCQDLTGERVLVLDDIRCTGASEAVWNWALTEIAGAHPVTAFSLAQAEGMDPEQDVLDVETEGIRREAQAAAGIYGKAFDIVWLEAPLRVLHRHRRCRSIPGEVLPWWRAVGKGTQDCPVCLRPRAGIFRWLTRRPI